MNLKNLKISTKLYLLVAAFIGGFGLFSLVAKSTVDELKVGGPIYQHIIEDKDLIADILPPPEYIIEPYLRAALAVNETDPEHLKEHVDTFWKLRQDYEARRTYWAGLLPDGEEKRLITEEAYRPAQEFFTLAEREFFPALAAKDHARALAVLTGPMEQKYGAHRLAIDRLVTHATAAAAANEASANALAKKRSLLLVLIGLAIAVSATWLCFYIIRLISTPLRHAHQATSRIAKGELAVKIEVDGQDELGQMSGAMREMVANLRQIAGQITNSTATLASSSEELSTTSDELSRGAGQLSSQTEEVVLAMGGVARTITDMAQNATEAAAATQMASHTAATGKQIVDKTAEDMIRIAGTVQSAAETIEGLGRSTAQIGEIVAVINEIADQTNMLALNAAIEAARAGEKGRGFAVVADEVRKLAERTMRATNDIGDKIGMIQRAAKESVRTMQVGREEVNQGVTLAREASASLESIVNASATAMGMVQRIAAATQEQSAATEQVSRNMENMAIVTRQSSASSEQIRASAAELALLATGLNDTTAWFKL